MLFRSDAVRYFVLHEMPFAADGIMTYELIIERINSELANILGNLVNRTIAMDTKYFDGVVMEPSAPEAVDEELKAVALAMPGKVKAKMDELSHTINQNENYTRFAAAQNAVNDLMQRINATISYYAFGVEPSNCTHDCSTCGGCH